MRTEKNHSVNAEAWCEFWILMRGQIRDIKGALIGKKVNMVSKMSEITLKTDKDRTRTERLMM